MRKEDFPLITYYCPHCHALNQPKQFEDCVSSDVLDQPKKIEILVSHAFNQPKQAEDHISSSTPPILATLREKGNLEAVDISGNSSFENISE